MGRRGSAALPLHEGEQVFHRAHVECVADDGGRGHHVFAEIKPASHKRIDLGFALEDEPFTSRLVDTGGKAKKARISHKVAITTEDDIDLQVRRWLKQAYERDEWRMSKVKRRMTDDK